MSEEQLLTTAEVAHRLRIKPETIYAYVSRGLLARVKLPGERTSRFRLADVERLAARTQGTRPERDTAATMRTATTLIAYGRLHYRGLDAAKLAPVTPFEEVARWLWTGQRRAERFAAPAETVDGARRAAAHLPAHARTFDRLPVVVALAAALDPLRFDLAPATVVAIGPVLLATMVDALPLAGSAIADDHNLAARLWPRLTGEPATAEGLRALNATLVLLADHDLAASTIAVRVAASTRANPYAAVLAGLGALDGPMHGAVGGAVHRMIESALRDGTAAAIAESLRGGGLPGFGHPRHPDGDPRAAALLDLVAPLPLPDGLRRTVDELIATALRRGSRPNVDFAVAVLAHASGMGPGAAEVIFAIARTAGWIAHVVEEYAQPSNRFRWSSGYTGPTPQSA
ncbi:helix-turn-helix domain-containing protein [Micromonospora sp. WP24]|uniref:citrate/2-methylcitrate synthase n=1 Tax=Micromonospora sp. WP24 TaxID=2604469 RepID=UPI0011D5179C|nr:citrate/2-methylcitrate synthase [Micromonospora sp. WP24]TYC05569.1 helix-turn-helix domain-containing protein [Micromonospora sp. WP24]